MSLTGNSIPIKFTPFGRIQKQQDGVQETEESGETDRCWGRGLGPRVRPGSSLHGQNFSYGLGRALLPSKHQFPHTPRHLPELVDEMG